MKKKNKGNDVNKIIKCIEDFENDNEFSFKKKNNERKLFLNDSLIKELNLNKEYNIDNTNFTEIYNHKNIAQKEAVLNNSSKYLSIKANNSNKLLLNQEIDSNYDSSKNDLYSNLKTYWDSTLFSINNNISLTINSSYENYNIISGQKLIKSKNLQNKLKEYLLKESFNISNDNDRKNAKRKRKR